ncbi:hypothetical protein [Marinomonas sp. FW-1]|uniref:hypothetical protein n=1 Tax=Marinomonas sp. FW-1 TaxID=2071621 RepID=UPI0020C7BEBD|nr:hypothetical protein [Marinomonas sp. FW-1]
MINYHPSIETLTDYAAGSLPLAHSLCVSTHIEHCSECQQQIRKLEMLGTHLFEQAKTEKRRLDSLKDSFFQKLAELPEQDILKKSKRQQSQNKAGKMSIVFLAAYDSSSKAVTMI